jgi:CHAT domain-containing protein
MGTGSGESKASDGNRAGAETEQLQRRILALEREVTTRVRRLEAAPGGAVEHAAFRRLGQLGARLAADEVLIEYFVAEGRILAAVVTRNRRSLHVLEVPARSVQVELDHLRLQMETLAATSNRMPENLVFLRKQSERRLQRLFTLLLAPLLSGHQSGGRLTIVPHDLLHQVPFECLYDGNSYLDSSWIISRCPTAGFLLERRARRRKRAPGRTVVIAGTRAGSPFIRSEARAVLECYGGENGTLLLDPAPTEALVSMRGARVIHVSAHGNFRADNPLFSTLHLGSGVLFLADILTATLTAELVVVSACNSGQTFSGRGDALLGMAHAFLAANAWRLVASLWRVHDQATAEWMELFHRQHQETDDPLAAHRFTAQALREKWPHPFYWGGFCILGA